jgi:AraC-like DNA-binding protein
MEGEQVRMWRPADENRVLLMAGQTTHYGIEPRGGYVFGVVTGQPMQSRRGPDRRMVLPGQLVAWDPSGAHAGAAVGARPWNARLMVVEASALAALAGDEETSFPADLALPEPVIPDQRLARGFLALHTALEAPATRLERDERLAEWLRALVERFPAGRPRRSRLSARDDKALRLACAYLGDRPERNVSLDELAIAAGIGKFRLARLFRQRTGLPPHALQVAHRIRMARRLLESGQTIAEAAATSGFASQSHLHGHFRRSLGMTPAEYQRRFSA